MDLALVEALQDLNTERNWTLILRDGMGVSDPRADRLLYVYLECMQYVPSNPTRDRFNKYIYARPTFVLRRRPVLVDEMVEDTTLLVTSLKI